VDRRPGYATSTTFFFRLKRSKVFQKQPVHEDVPAAHLAQEDALVCAVKEAGVVQWRRTVSPEHDAQDEMMDAGATAVNRPVGCVLCPQFPYLDNSRRFLLMSYRF
jgi:hypothetical protein